MKAIIITVDTEGDNLWNYHKGEKILTNNALFIPRFQTLCEKFEFKPVYLTNYEMICDDFFSSYIRQKVEQGLCEVGIHIHAWNNPPIFDLDGHEQGCPYLIEYPIDIMRAKIKETYELIVERIGKAPVSHRAGRWAMNEDYFKILEEVDIKVDCSFTPGISWRKSPGETIKQGTDYSGVNKSYHYVGNILEVPMSVRKMSHFMSFYSLRHSISTLAKGGELWLRPAMSSFRDMKHLEKIISREVEDNYLEFMLHSSELMPGGSPYFKNESSIEKMYKEVERFFEYLTSLSYSGQTLEEFCNSI